MAIYRVGQHEMAGSSRRLLAVVTAIVLVWSLAWLVVPIGADARPPGNNGTIKIDGEPFDSHPDNEPHVGCVFQVDFYGYDEGDLDAQVTFRAHPPTGTMILLEDVVDIGEDPAGGGTDLDASVTYDLGSALAGLTPHPNQGYHVKLTINADGSQGADTKHKVFWVDGCEPGTTTTTMATTTTTMATTTTTSETTTTTSETTTTTSETTTTTQSSSTTSDGST